MTFKLLTEHHLEILSLKGSCRGSSESIHVKMPNCWKSHASAQMVLEAVQQVQRYSVDLYNSNQRSGNYFHIYMVSVYCFSTLRQSNKQMFA